MSSKKAKSDNIDSNVEKQALKEAEIIAEQAPNERTRKEAEKLIERIEGDSIYSIQEQEYKAVESVLDVTKRTIKKTVNEVKREIPRYTKAIGGNTRRNHPGN